jgi:hypothetical protein
MTLENLLRIGKLKVHAAGKVEIERLLAAAERALADASVTELSSDSRLDLAYRAIVQAALAAMLANGYRPATSEPGHHHLLIQALPKTAGIAAERIRVLDAYELRGIWPIIAACLSPMRLHWSVLPTRGASWLTSARGSPHMGYSVRLTARS